MTYLAYLSQNDKQVNLFDLNFKQRKESNLRKSFILLIESDLPQIEQ